VKERDRNTVNAIKDLRGKIYRNEENNPFTRIVEHPIMPGAFGESHSYIMIGDDKYVSLKGVRAVMKLRPSYSADQIKIVYESGDDVIFDAGEGQQEEVFKEIIQMLK
jgi:hypothetical protein